MRYEVVIHNIKVWKFPILFYHFTVQMGSQFDSMVFATGLKDGVRRLSRSRSDLQYSFSGSDPGPVIHKSKQFPAVPRTESVKLVRDRVENSSKFILFQLMYILFRDQV